MASTLTVILGVLLAAAAEGFTPFDVVDNYVSQFEHSLKLMQTAPSYEEPLSTSYHFKEATEGSEEYDFIIVGAGASGSAIAARLSEVPEWKVLLLEAGITEDAITKIPAAEPYLRTTSYNWQYKTVPQNTSCLGTENFQCNIGSARAVGGDTAINDIVYIRGHPKDYDLWADEGLLGWCWQSVFPYFKKLEDNYAEDLDRKHHHYGGPVHLENFQHNTQITSQILEAAHLLEYKKIDYNGEERIGFGIPQVTTKDGKRYSAASAYLTKVYKRKNLVIRTGSRVTEVIISDHTKEARGVKYYHDGKMFTAKASKEVILAAGAINTAQLLLLSGIGPKKDLDSLEIPVASDLAVGQHLKDHVTFIGINFIIKDNKTEDTHKFLKDACPSDSVTQYLRYGKGPMSTNGIEVIGFIQTEVSKSKTPYPDIQLSVSSDLYNEGYQQLKYLNIRKDLYEAYWGPLQDKKGFRIEITLLHPKSTGYIKLDSKDPFSPPIVNPNSLSDEDDEDIDTILAGIHKALKLIPAEALHKYGTYLSPYQVPGCGNGGLDDEYWKCAIRHLSVNSRHVSSTAKMGEHDDKQAVVDKDLKVFGVYNLRVADSSVIPVSISGNLMAANYMIGEQAAEKIRREWLKEKCLCGQPEAQR